MTLPIQVALGRITVRLLDMLGDGCSRIHVAGLARKFGGIRQRLIQALADHLARPLTPVSCDIAMPFASLLHRGDVLLSNSNTRGAALVRRITGSPWSHVSLYVGPLDEGPDPPCVVEADMAAGVRTIRLSELNALQMRVLRPQVSDDERSRVAQAALECVGAAYDHHLAWTLGASLMRRRPVPCSPPTATARRFICCTLVAHSFALIGHQVLGLVPSDFERISLFDDVTCTGG